MFSLTEKVALITGSSRGIGRAMAEAMARAGARVVISSRNGDACEAVAAGIRDAGGDAMAVACNVSHRDQLERLVERATESCGKIDILVCNAAVNPYFGSLMDISDEAYDKIMTVNVKNTLWLCRLVIPQMTERRDGVIIVISSIAGLKGSRKLGAYALSKAADMQLVRNLALECAGSNVRVNGIAPGLVRTDFARALWEDPETSARALESYPLGRLGEPEDIAGAAVFLASAAGAWITGQTLVIDGGAAVSAGRYS